MISALLGVLFGNKNADNRRKLRDGDTLLASVHCGELLGFTFDVGLSHAEFVRREIGTLPSGAWVGTVRKFNRRIVAVNSKTFFDNQLPAPDEVQSVIFRSFK